MAKEKNQSGVPPVKKRGLYDASSSRGYGAGWDAKRGTAESEVADHIKIEGRARDLYRNSPIARTIVDTHEQLLIHGGVNLTLQGEGKSESKNLLKIRDLMYEVLDGNEMDMDRVLSFTELQNSIVRENSIAGGIFALRIIDKESPLGFRVKLVEQSQLASDHNKSQNGNRVFRGIELDRRDRPVAYWFYPSQDESKRRKPVRYEAKDVAHPFYPTRVGSLMGISWLAPAMPHIRMLEDILHAAQRRQRTAQAFSGFVTPPVGARSTNIAFGKDQNSPSPAEERGIKPLRKKEGELKRSFNSDEYMKIFTEIEPDTVYLLDPGEKIDLAEPPAPYDLASLVRPIAQMISKCSGVSYEAIFGDFAASSYSSTRMADTQPRLWVGQRRQMLKSRFFDPFWIWCNDGLQLKGYDTKEIWHRWQFPMLASAHPKEEAEIWRRKIEVGSTTVSAWIRETGNDPDAVFEERAAELKKMRELGIIGGSDAGSSRNDTKDSDDSSDSQAGDTDEKSLLQ